MSEKKPSKSRCILIVEDEATIVEVLQYNLEREGFEVMVVARGDDVLPTVRQRRPDLILLDLMLPGLSGLELTRLLRRDPQTAEVPIVMLTARCDEIDRVVGFELGADDYVTKPFSPRELILRIRAILRRIDSASPPIQRKASPGTVLQIGTIRIHPEAFRAYVEDREILLTATEFRLLNLLMERQGRVQKRSTLLQEVWGYSDDVDSRTVDTHIGRLRHKLGKASRQVETVIGVGYRLNPL